jgi:TolB-like protein
MRPREIGQEGIVAASRKGSLAHAAAVGDGRVERWPAITPLAGWALLLLSACAGRQAGPVTPEREEARAAARRAVSTERTLDVNTLSQRSLGVPPFAVHSSDSTLAALGYGLADLLTTDLARSANLEVVDRIRLEAVLQEVHLVDAGRIDTTSAPRLGRLVQARRLVLGAISQQPDGRLSLHTEIADVPSGALVPATAARLQLADILQAEKELAFTLFERLAINLTPAERRSVEQMPTRSVAAFLAYGRGVRFELEGRYGEAAREYQQAVRIDPGFQAAVDRLAGVPEASPHPLPPVQQASAGAPRAVEIVTDRINERPFSPLGSQLIASPGEGGDDLVVPTTVTITVTVPE